MVAGREPPRAVVDALVDLYERESADLAGVKYLVLEIEAPEIVGLESACS